MVLTDTLYYFLYLTIELMLLFVGITFIVGMILQYVKPSTVKRVLSSNHKGVGNILGAGLGALTPFCSCSTIPILVGLLNSGAPFGASMSFLIASPVLNPIIIGLLLSLFGWKMTGLYVIITFGAAVFAGIIWERLGLAKEVKKVKILGGQEAATDEDIMGKPFKDKLVSATGEAVNLFRQVLPYLILGAAIGAVIKGYVPEWLVIKAAGPNNPFAIPVAAVIGVPMYVRAATMIPISAVLLEKGMGIGAIVALIIGGAGASIPEVTLLGSIFKRKLVIAFLVTVFSIAIMAGFLFTFLTGWLW
jgi:uncharacterized membrane protein YraQ (UPF0718 family)